MATEKKKSSVLSWLVTLSIAAVALYYSLRGVEWRRIGETVSHANPWYLALVFSMTSLSIVVRSVRWGVLLSAEEKIPVSTVFWATAVGYLGNAVLPARAGELLRTQMVSARSGLTRSYVFATALTGLAMDVIVLVVLSAIVIVTLPGTPEWLKKGSGSMAIFGLVGMAVLVVLPHCEPLVTRILRMTPGPEKLRLRLIGIGEQFLLGLRAFHHVSRFAVFAFISFTVWFLDAAGAMMVARALHIPLPFAVALLLIAGLALASSAPSTPGYVGVYQIVAVGILPEFGISKSDAIAFILVLQGVNYVVVLFWGFCGLWQLKRSSAPNVREPAPDPDSVIASGPGPVH
jgi:glycosyltransferase 2 family protein